MQCNVPMLSASWLVNPSRSATMNDQAVMIGARLMTTNLEESTCVVTINESARVKGSVEAKFMESVLRGR